MAKLYEDLTEVYGEPDYRVLSYIGNHVIPIADGAAGPVPVVSQNMESDKKQNNVD
ncbi:hypothetical protein [Lactovum odontotermitis]